MTLDEMKQLYREWVRESTGLPAECSDCGHPKGDVHRAWCVNATTI